jgi:hypothetical protein
MPEALDGVPGHSEGAGVLYVNVRFQHLAVLDQMVALDDVKLFRMRVPNPSTHEPFGRGALPSEGKGRMFESSRARQSNQ